ncbi:transcriptional regulator [Bacillus toyonensis]|uniref:ArsR/SmtB family transcription factor n=1 Tax=Bacillus toyonensis TaxID=155322 RepID=UPI003D1A2E8A
MSNAFQMEFKHYERVAKIFGLLGEKNCLLIVHELIVSGTLNIFELSAALNIPQHTISQDLQRLYTLKIISCEYKDRLVYCKVEDETVIKIIKALGLLN